MNPLDPHRLLAIPRPGLSRRAVLGMLAPLAALPLASAVATLLNSDEAAAGRRQRRKHRHRGRKDSGKRKKGCRRVKKARVCAGKCGPVRNRRTCGKTVGCGVCICNPACPPCFTCDAASLTCVNQCADGQTCQSGICGVACAGSFCPASIELCVAGSCQTCDVSCADGASPAACGAALQAALDDASLSTIRVCAGRYQGGFEISRAVTVVGAGDSDNPVGGTILDGAAAQRVLLIPDGSGTVTLQGVRLARGKTPFPEAGAGIRQGADPLIMSNCTIDGAEAGWSGGGLYSLGLLTMTGCTISNNRATNPDTTANYGGVAVNSVATFTDCHFLNNHADVFGGGLVVGDTATATLDGASVVQGNSAATAGGVGVGAGALTVGPGVRITQNTADAGKGGGIYSLMGGNVTLQGAAPSPIVTDNCHENCATNSGTIAGCAAGGTCAF
ncbi:MAG: right-handed parallel beta-helix repeat-containing protein [Thermomicrobiales bacterium]